MFCENVKKCYLCHRNYQFLTIKHVIMKKSLLIMAMFVASVFTANAQNDEINNQTVLDLLAEGFSSEEIIGAIENSTTRTITFDISYMRKLKAAGADATLTSYLQKIAKVDNGYEGVVLWNPVGGGKPTKIYRCNFEKEKKGFNLGTIGAIAGAAYGVGSAVSGRRVSGGEAAAVTAGVGLMISSGKDIEKLMIPGSKAKIVASRQPVFRFFFNKVDNASFNAEHGNWYEMVMNDIQSPNEFQLIKMQVKENKKGGRRLFPNSMSYTVAGFSGTNASTREMVNFDVNPINNNTFEVTFSQPLEPGEYCFFYKSGLQNKYFQTQPFGFDFTVE